MPRTYTTVQLGPKMSLTPQGYLLCEDVAIARTGTMLYAAGEVPIEDDQGLIVIERNADEVFRPATIASFEGMAVTVDHPPVDVDPSNWNELARGVLQDVRRGQGIEDDLLLANLLITNAGAIQKIRDEGLREVSCGYDADYEQIRPGRGRQTNILGNHLALVEKGRCGSRCAIGDSMKKLKFIDRLRAAFKARDEAEFENSLAESVKDAEAEEAEAKKKKYEEDGKTSDALTKLVTSVDALTNRVAALETKDAAAAGTKDGEGEEEESEEAKKKKAEDKARDTAALVEEVKETVARAEILAPGLHMPTTDAAADPQKTRDAVCGLKRKALQRAFEGKYKDAVAAFVGKTADFAGMTCDAVSSAFLGASEVARQINNAAQTKGTFDGTKAAGAMAKSISDINAKNASFWSRS